MTQEQPSTKVALVAEPRGLGSEIPDWSPRPTFSTTADGKTQATIAADPGSAFGVYADSAWRMKVNLQSGIQFTSDGPPFRVIVIRGSNPQKVLTRMSKYTGKIELPPLWALGYQQCRFSCYPESRVKEIA